MCSSDLVGIDMYTLMCIKLMTNKNLLYKKINKIKFKNKKKNFLDLKQSASGVVASVTDSPVVVFPVIDSHLFCVLCLAPACLQVAPEYRRCLPT